MVQNTNGAHFGVPRAASVDDICNTSGAVGTVEVPIVLPVPAVLAVPPVPVVQAAQPDGKEKRSVMR